MIVLGEHQVEGYSTNKQQLMLYAQSACADVCAFKSILFTYAHISHPFLCIIVLESIHASVMTEK